MLQQKLETSKKKLPPKDWPKKSKIETLLSFNNPIYSLKRRFQQNQNDCVFTVISLLPTLSDQILNEMNIEAEWAKLQKSRDLEKVEKKLKEEKETATLMKEEKEITEPIVIDENKEDQEAVLKSTPNNLDASVGSLSTSVHSDDSNNMPFPPGILDKKQKQLIWETIKTKSKHIMCVYRVFIMIIILRFCAYFYVDLFHYPLNIT